MLKVEIKRDLMLHYDTIQSEIDIEVQRQLVKLEKLGMLKNNDLLEKNELMINQVKNIYDMSMNQVNDYFKTINDETANKDQLKKDILSKYCIFISKSNVSYKFKDKLAIGILIISDSYLNSSQTNYVRYKITLFF